MDRLNPSNCWNCAGSFRKVLLLQMNFPLLHISGSSHVVDLCGLFRNRQQLLYPAVVPHLHIWLTKKMSKWGKYFHYNWKHSPDHRVARNGRGRLDWVNKESSSHLLVPKLLPQSFSTHFINPSRKYLANKHVVELPVNTYIQGCKLVIYPRAIATLAVLSEPFVPLLTPPSTSFICANKTRVQLLSISLFTAAVTRRQIT